MSRFITERGRQREKRGTGKGKDYIPYLTASDFSSIGTTAACIDWITGRTVETLSQGESDYWHLLRFNDDICDIREQFPLELKATNALAEKHNVRPFKNGEFCMTTDFLIDFIDGHQEAHSVKPSRKALENKSTAKSLFLEQQYWLGKGIRYKIVFASELNKTFIRNIRFCVQYYNPGNISTRVDCLKHLIAHKKIKVDMTTEIIDIQKLLKIYESEVESLWEKLK